MPDRRERLRKAADLDLQHKLATLADAGRRTKRLAEKRQLLADERVEAHDPIATGRAMSLWRAWREIQLSEIALEEARLRAERETIHDAAARAFGRIEVLKALEAKALIRPPGGRCPR